MVFSSFLGGMGSDDTGTGIALDGSANIYVTGFTHSRDFPITAGAFQTLLNRSTFGDAHDAFVTMITPGDTPPPETSLILFLQGGVQTTLCSSTKLV
jgi:hypothetical protein